MIQEKLKKDFKDGIENNKQMLAIVLLASRIRELKKIVEKKIDVTDKWSVYSGECRAYKDVLEELNKLMKYI